VEDGDVVGVQAQQLLRSIAVTSDVSRDRFEAEAIADRLCHVALVLDDQHPHAPMLEPPCITGVSKTAYVPVTPRYLEWRHRPPPGTTRRIRVAGLLGVITAIAAASGYQVLATSCSASASPIDRLRSAQRGAAGEAVPSTVWPAYGQAAFVRAGQSQIHAGPN